MAPQYLDRYPLVFTPNADVPAYGIVQATPNWVNHSGTITLNVKKYAGGSPSLFFVASPFGTKSGKHGHCTTAFNSPILALAGETLAAGDTCGPKSGEWGLWKSGSGFLALGASDAHNLVVVMQTKWTKRCSAQLTAALASGDSPRNVDHVVAIDGGSSPLSDPTSTSETIAGYNVRGFRAKSGAVCVIEYNTATSHWEIVWVKPLANMIMGSGPGTAVAGGATYTLSSLASLDGGDLPGTTVSVTNYATGLPASATNVVVVHDGSGGYRTLDAPCPA